MSSLLTMPRHLFVSIQTNTRGRFKFSDFAAISVPRETNLVNHRRQIVTPIKVIDSYRSAALVGQLTAMGVKHLEGTPFTLITVP